MIDIMKLRKLEKEQKEKDSQKAEEKPKKKRTSKKDKPEVKKEVEIKDETIEYEVVEDDKSVDDRSNAGNEPISEKEAAEENKTAEEDDDKAQQLRDKLLEELLADDSFGSRIDNTDETDEKLAEAEMAAAQGIKEEKPVKQSIKTAETKAAKSQKQEEIKSVPLSDIPKYKDEDVKDDLQAVENVKLKNEEAKGKIDNVVQVIGFVIGKECYGIEIKDIQEIIRMVDITRVPNVPNFIEGVINLRGKVLPVVNLRKKVNMEKIDFTSKTRIIVLEKENTSLGFIVDSIKEVIRIPENQLEPPPEITMGDTSDYIKSVAKVEEGMVILLDSNRLLERKHL